MRAGGEGQGRGQQAPQPRPELRAEQIEEVVDVRRGDGGVGGAEGGVGEQALADRGGQF